MTVWTKQAKPTTAYSKEDLRRDEGFLLLQDGNDLLLQDDSFFLITGIHISWIKDALRAIGNTFLLLETGFRILNEDLTRMILDQGVGWQKEAKGVNLYTKEELRRNESFLLLQDGGEVLLQNGGNFLISGFHILWTKEEK